MNELADEIFLQKAESEFKSLFTRAKSKNELHFAFSLAPEFRPYATNTAYDTKSAIEDYIEFLNKNEKSPIQPRIALALYSHLSEASGFWEIPKNLLSVSAGNSYSFMPFFELVQKYGSAEGSIAPNSNKIMRSLMKYSDSLGFPELAVVFKEAFDSDLRNGYAHADYALLSSGVCVGQRYKKERIISWLEFNRLINKAVNFYEVFMKVFLENLSYYNEPKTIKGFLEKGKPEGTWTIHNSKKGFSISGSIGPPQKA